MTDPHKPTSSTASRDPKFVKDVAKQVDRRGVRRKFLLFLALISSALLALYYGTCGSGWGIGKGKGSGAGSGPGSSEIVAAANDAGVRRCAILITASGITVDGEPTTRSDAVTKCKLASGADVIVAGDTRQGDWDALRAALDAAGIEIFKREPKAGLIDGGVATDAPTAEATATAVDGPAPNDAPAPDAATP